MVASSPKQQLSLLLIKKLQIIKILHLLLVFCNISIPKHNAHVLRIYTYYRQPSSKSWYCELFFFFYLGFLSQPFMNHRTAGEGEGHSFKSSTPLPPTSTDTQTLAGWLLQRAHLCTQVAAGLELGTFGFQAQVANHSATCPLLKVYLDHSCKMPSESQSVPHLSP